MVKNKWWDDHIVSYEFVKSLYYAPETNTIFFIFNQQIYREKNVGFLVDDHLVAF